VLILELSILTSVNAIGLCQLYGRRISGLYPGKHSCISRQLWCGTDMPKAAEKAGLTTQHAGTAIRTRWTPGKPRLLKGSYVTLGKLGAHTQRRQGQTVVASGTGELSHPLLFRECCRALFLCSLPCLALPCWAQSTRCNIFLGSG